ncbi:MAG: hypothetical protein ACD_40C00075G0004, partial [uncultured bacterium]
MANQLRTVKQAKVAGKRVIVRVDWNVTIGKALQIVDDTRIARTLPTIKWLLAQKAAQVILVSHLGKAEEKRSLKQIGEYASGLVGSEIVLFDQLTRVPEERVVMLENVRWFQGEIANSDDFAKELATMGEVYVNEAFGESHRLVASIIGIPKYLPSYAGLWLADEVATIIGVREKPER